MDSNLMNEGNVIFNKTQHNLIYSYMVNDHIDNEETHSCHLMGYCC